MSRPHPHCDRHPNLQMVSCWVQRAGRIVAAHICPVPGCGRVHVEGMYVEASEIKMVLGPNTPLGNKAIFKKPMAKQRTPEKPLNRQTAARAAILKAIEEKQRT